jgi:hypothetical protein
VLQPLRRCYRRAAPLGANPLTQPAPCACRHLAPTLEASIAARLSDSPAQALQHAFLQLDDGFRRQWGDSKAQRIAARCGEDVNPGCTALVALLAGGSLYVANAGGLLLRCC